MHFVLETAYGESGDYFDDWKGTFSFPFALAIVKGDRTDGHLMNVTSFRSSTNFALRKIVHCDQADDIVHPPFEEEFSRKEINYFLAYSVGNLERFFIVLKSC